MAPGELASLRRMYIIERGMVLYAGKVLTSGKLWAVDDVILTAGLLKYERLDRARTMTYVEYRELSRDDFMEVVANEPTAQRLIRKLAVFVALRRFMIARAMSVRSPEERFGRGTNFLSAMTSAANLQTLKEYDRLQAAERMAVAASTTDNSHSHFSSGGGAASGKALEEVNHSLVTLTETVVGIASAVSDMQRQLSHLQGHTPGPILRSGAEVEPASATAPISNELERSQMISNEQPTQLNRARTEPDQLGTSTMVRARAAMASCRSVSVMSADPSTGNGLHGGEQGAGRQFGRVSIRSSPAGGQGQTSRRRSRPRQRPPLVSNHDDGSTSDV